MKYDPVWQPDVPVRQHLAETHGMAQAEIDKLSDVQCLICHDDLHSKKLGEFWLTGRYSDDRHTHRHPHPRPDRHPISEAELRLRPPLLERLILWPMLIMALLFVISLVGLLIYGIISPFIRG
jgi:hypothetical protein